MISVSLRAPIFISIVSTIIFSVTFAIGETRHHHTTGILLSPDSDLSYDEEYTLFEKEGNVEPTDHEHLSRHKRFIYLNVDTNMAVALLIGIPLTFVLPSMTNLFSSWRRKRSIEDHSINTWNLQDHPAAKPEMDKVYTYFQLLDIPELPCQLRAVCEFSADPDKFHPLSDLILKRIRNPNLPALLYFDVKKDNHFTTSAGLNYSALLHQEEGRLSSTPTKSLYDLYNEAADEGQIYGYEKCHQHFETTCHYPIEKLLNMPVIRFWNALQSLLKLSFKDVSFK